MGCSYLFVDASRRDSLKEFKRFKNSGAYFNLSKVFYFFNEVAHELSIAVINNLFYKSKQSFVSSRFV